MTVQQINGNGRQREEVLAFVGTPGMVCINTVCLARDVSMLWAISITTQPQRNAVPWLLAACARGLGFLLILFFERTFPCRFC